MCEDTSHFGRGETLGRMDTCGNWLQTCPMSLLNHRQPPFCLGHLSGELRENIHHGQTVKLNNDSHWLTVISEVHCLLVYPVDRLVDCGLWSLATRQNFVVWRESVTNRIRGFTMLCYRALCIHVGAYLWMAQITA